VRLTEAISAVETCATVEVLASTLQRIIESYGFSGFSFVDAGRPHLDIPYNVSTTSQRWQADYKSNRFIQVDPMVSKARRTNVPFPWSEVPIGERLGKNKLGAHQLMEAAQDHGFTNGYVFPFHFVDVQGRIYSTVNGLFWKDDADRMSFLNNARLKHELDLILLYWTERAIKVAGAKLRQTPERLTGFTEETQVHPLSDREREVVAWAGRGLTAADTAEVLKIGEETVQTHIRNAIQKLNATNKTHAVAKAIQLGIIDL
jgi:DNA-binding CsgD family transcriptional regulator